MGDDTKCCKPVMYSVPGEMTGRDTETKRAGKGHSLPAAAEGRGQETERKRASKRHSLAGTECKTSFSGVHVFVWM